MSNSPLATYVHISPNQSGERNHVIDTVTIHCVAAQWTAQRTVDYLANPSVKASCNYAVGKDGSIAMGVEEGHRSWCSSSGSNDNRAVTIEVASDSQHPFAVTDKAMQSLIKLLVDICKRNNIPELRWKNDKSLIGHPEQQNMTVHRWFANKDCPGEYLLSRHGWIAEQVNRILRGDLPFIDVPSNSWYADSVKWAYDNKISSGVSEDCFAPEKTCTRAEAITMLWKANGSPEPVTYHPFSDIFPTDWYCKAVQWAIQQGVTAGVDENHFAPKNECTRAEAVTFLWALDGKKEAHGDSYVDVHYDNWFYQPVYWAKQNGIASGVGQGKFDPKGECTRAMFVTMLHKMFN